MRVYSVDAEPAPTWPTREAYDEAMMKWRTTLRDDELRRAELYITPMQVPRSYGDGLHVTLYRIGDWMVRCFCSRSKPTSNPPIDIRTRYQSISRFVAQNRKNVSALLALDYQEQGIEVSGKWWPIVKMPFLKSSGTFTEWRSLGSFIQDNHSTHQTMHALAEAWRGMTRELEVAPMAHGDLDLTNVWVESRVIRFPWRSPVVVRSSGSHIHDSSTDSKYSSSQEPLLTLKLIDYDNFWIPDLKRLPQTEFGHKQFQHPAFWPPNSRPYNQYMDRFSALAIYIMLRALEVQPSLYEELRADSSERLLFSRADYDHPMRDGSSIMLIRRRCGNVMHPYVDELCASLAERRMPGTLDEIASGKIRASVAIVAPPPADPPSRPLGSKVYIPTSSRSQPPDSSAPLPPFPKLTPLLNVPVAKVTAPSTNPVLSIVRAKVSQVFSQRSKMRRWAIGTLAMAGLVLVSLIAIGAMLSTSIGEVQDYSARIPGPSCDKGAGSWAKNSTAKVVCLQNEMQLSNTSGGYIAEVFFTMAFQHFPRNVGVTVTIDNLAPGSCAGIVVRSRSGSFGGYGMYICDSGYWYINRYTADSGKPDRLADGNITPESNYKVSTTLQPTHKTISINNSPIKVVDDATFTAIEEIGLAVDGHDNKAGFKDFTYAPVQG